MKAEEIVEEVGQVLKSGFGPRVAIGLMIGLMSGVTAERCREYITENKPLFYWLTDEDWNKYAHHARGVKLDTITYEAVYKRLEKRRADLAAVIKETKGGTDWLRDQIERLKSKIREATA